MLVSLPNKYTGKMKWYVLEMTRNLQRFNDAFKDVPVHGFSLFRLYERLHGVPGANVWWVPLKEELPADPKQNMIDWIKQVHSDNLKTIDVPSSSSGSSMTHQNGGNGSGGHAGAAGFGCIAPHELTKLADAMGLKMPKLDVEELASAFVVMTALRMGGRRFPVSEGKYVTPLELVTAFDHFEEPKTLREVS
jgi:hypothetical protein